MMMMYKIVSVRQVEAPAAAVDGIAEDTDLFFDAFSDTKDMGRHIQKVKAGLYENAFRLWQEMQLFSQAKQVTKNSLDYIKRACNHSPTRLTQGLKDIVEGVDTEFYNEKATTQFHARTHSLNAFKRELVTILLTLIRDNNKPVIDFFGSVGLALPKTEEEASARMAKHTMVMHIIIKTVFDRNDESSVKLATAIEQLSTAPSFPLDQFSYHYPITANVPTLEAYCITHAPLDSGTVPSCDDPSAKIRDDMINYGLDTLNYIVINKASYDIIQDYVGVFAIPVMLLTGFISSLTPRAERSSWVLPSSLTILTFWMISSYLENPDSDPSYMANFSTALVMALYIHTEFTRRETPYDTVTKYALPVAHGGLMAYLFLYQAASTLNSPAFLQIVGTAFLHSAIHEFRPGLTDRDQGSLTRNQTLLLYGISSYAAYTYLGDAASLGMTVLNALTSLYSYTYATEDAPSRIELYTESALLVYFTLEMILASYEVSMYSIVIPLIIMLIKLKPIIDYVVPTVETMIYNLEPDTAKRLGLPIAPAYDQSEVHRDELDIDPKFTLYAYGEGMRRLPKATDPERFKVFSRLVNSIYLSSYEHTHLNGLQKRYQQLAIFNVILMLASALHETHQNSHLEALLKYCLSDRTESSTEDCSPAYKYLSKQLRSSSKGKDALVKSLVTFWETPDGDDPGLLPPGDVCPAALFDVPDTDVCTAGAIYPPEAPVFYDPVMLLPVILTMQVEGLDPLKQHPNILDPSDFSIFKTADELSDFITTHVMPIIPHTNKSLLSAFRAMTKHTHDDHTNSPVLRQFHQGLTLHIKALSKRVKIDSR